MKDETVLEKIGISNEIVEKWKKRGLKISYPMRPRKKFFKSDDGKLFVETADKFVIPLTRKETEIYTKNPQRFKEDFLGKHIKIYRDFYKFIDRHREKIKKLRLPERISALLSLLYLFQSVMDHHYYHFDRYLVYEKYPQTPVGYWWKRLKDLYSKATKKKIINKKLPEDFLQILSRNRIALNALKKKLSPKDFGELNRALKAIKIFEETQQKEVEIAIDLKTGENIAMRTGFPLWDELCNEIINHYSEILKKSSFSKIKKIIKKNPIFGIRDLFQPPNLKCFNIQIFSQFKKEIKRWL